MELTLKILLGIVTLICLLGGMNLLLKGANYFLPKNIPPQRILDDLFRFLSGIYFALGFLVAWVFFNIQHIHNYMVVFILHGKFLQED